MQKGWLARRIAVSTVIIIVVTIAALEVHHFSVFGDFVPLGLHADFIEYQADLGIPGITKVYEPRLANYGLLPAKIQYCDAISDVRARETMAAYEVEWFNPKSKAWETVASVSGSDFCRPYPLGLIEAHAKSKWFWFGESILTGGEATAARDFHKGDLARFVLLTRVEASSSETRRIPTRAFTIDEETQESGVNFRIRH